MADCVVDTNVLLVASAAHPYSPFDDCDIAPAGRQAVLDWVMAFRRAARRKLVLDEVFKIYEEYRNKMTDQDLGLQVVHEKMQQALRQVRIEYDRNGYAQVPPAFRSFDPSDRKFLAALLHDVSGIRLVNATDTDWLEIEDELAAAGATVEHILQDWLRAKYEEKQASQ